MNLYVLPFLVVFSIFTNPSFFSQIEEEIPYQKSIDSLVELGKEDQLISFFEGKIEKNPKNTDAFFWLGKIYQEQLEFEKSSQFTRKALKLDPTCYRCYLTLAQNTANLGKSELALSQLDSLFNIKPDYGEAFVIRALIKEQAGQDAGAILDLNKAIALEPKHAAFYFARGNYYLRKNFSSSALPDFNKALALDPEYADAYYERAKLYFGKEDFKSSLNDMNQAVNIDSTFSDYYLGRATVFSALEEHQAAISDLNRVIRMDSLNYYGYYYLAQELYQLEDMNQSCENLHIAKKLLKAHEGEDQLKKLVDLSLENYCDSAKASFFYQRGVADYNTREYSNAVEIYSLGLKKFPNNSMILSFRGNAYFMLNKHELALRDYQTALEHLETVKPEIKANERQLQEKGISFELYYATYQAGIYLQLSETKLALNKTQEALIDINQAIKLLPNAPGIGAENYYNVRGNIFLLNGLYADALTDFEKSIQLNSSFAVAYVNRAVSQLNLSSKPTFKTLTLQAGMNQENFQVNWQLPIKAKAETDNLIKALVDCNKAIDLDPNLAYAYYIRGQIKRFQQNPDACFDFKKAKELGYPVEEEFLKNCK